MNFSSDADIDYFVHGFASRSQSRASANARSRALAASASAPTFAAATAALVIAARASAAARAACNNSIAATFAHRPSEPDWGARHSDAGAGRAAEPAAPEALPPSLTAEAPPALTPTQAPAPAPAPTLIAALPPAKSPAPTQSVFSEASPRAEAAATTPTHGLKRVFSSGAGALGDMISRGSGLAGEAAAAAAAAATAAADAALGDSATASGESVLDVHVFLPITRGASASSAPPARVTIRVRDSASAGDVVVQALVAAEGRIPGVPAAAAAAARAANGFELRLHDEGGRPDFDFPALDRTRAIRHFAAADEHVYCLTHAAAGGGADDNIVVTAAPYPVAGPATLPSPPSASAADAPPQALRVLLQLTAGATPTVSMVPLKGILTVQDVLQILARRHRLPLHFETLILRVPPAPPGSRSGGARRPPGTLAPGTELAPSTLIANIGVETVELVAKVYADSPADRAGGGGQAVLRGGASASSRAAAAVRTSSVGTRSTLGDEEASTGPALSVRALAARFAGETSASSARAVATSAAAPPSAPSSVSDAAAAAKLSARARGADHAGGGGGAKGERAVGGGRESVGAAEGTDGGSGDGGADADDGGGAGSGGAHTVHRVGAATLAAASAYYEWHVLKTNRRGVAQERILGIDLTRLVNRRRTGSSLFAFSPRVTTTRTTERLISDIVRVSVPSGDERAFIISVWEQQQGERGRTTLGQHAAAERVAVAIPYVAQTAAEREQILQKLEALLSLTGEGAKIVRAAQRE